MGQLGDGKGVLVASYRGQVGARIKNGAWPFQLEIERHIGLVGCEVMGAIRLHSSRRPKTSNHRHRLHSPHLPILLRSSHISPTLLNSVSFTLQPDRLTAPPVRLRILNTRRPAVRAGFRSPEHSLSISLRRLPRLKAPLRNPEHTSRLRIADDIREALEMSPRRTVPQPVRSSCGPRKAVPRPGLRARVAPAGGRLRSEESRIKAS